MKSNYSLIIITFLTIATFGCKSISCEEFDLNRLILEWHFFPDLETQYVFSDSLSNQLILDQTNFVQNEFEERCCHMCACFQFLKTTYENQSIGLNFSTYLNYDSEIPEWEGSIQYQINNQIMDLEVEGNSLNELNSGNQEKTLNISQLQSITILGKDYQDVLELEIINENNPRVSKLWIKKTIGLIGFKIDGANWIKE